MSTQDENNAENVTHVSQEVLADVSTEGTVDGATGVEVGDVVEPATVEFSEINNMHDHERPWHNHDKKPVLQHEEASQVFATDAEVETIVGQTVVVDGEESDIIDFDGVDEVPAGAVVLEEVATPNPEQQAANETTNEPVAEEAPILESPAPRFVPTPVKTYASEAERVEAERQEEAARQAKMATMNAQLKEFFHGNDPALINLFVTNVANLILNLTDFSQRVANSVQNALVYANHQSSQSEMTNIMISREALENPNLRVQYVGLSTNPNEGFNGYLFKVFGAANETETTVSAFSHQLDLPPLVRAHLVKQFQLLQARDGENFSAYFSVSAMAPRNALKRMAEGKSAPVDPTGPVEVVGSDTVQ